MDLADLPRRLSDLLDFPFVAVLVHGSRARGDFDRLSDTDVLLLLESGLSRSTVIVDGEDSFDIKALRADLIRTKMNESRSDNNNSFLRAMFDGVILYDPTSVLTELQSEGKSLWDAGPSLPSQEEIAQLHRDVAVVFSTAERTVQRALSDELGKGLTWLLLHNSFTSMASKYHRLKRFWRPSMTMLIAESACYDPELSTLCVSFLQSESPEEALACLRRLMTRCLEHDTDIFQDTLSSQKTFTS